MQYKVLNKGFADCSDCNVWSLIPVNFNEAKDFVQCPLCKLGMKLARDINPITELAYSTKNQVEGGLMPQYG